MFNRLPCYYNLLQGGDDANLESNNLDLIKDLLLRLRLFKFDFHPDKQFLSTQSTEFLRKRYLLGNVY